MKKLLIILAICVMATSFALPAYSHEGDSDDTLNPFKLAAYAVYPAGLALDIFVVKPLHWIVNLPIMNKITGHNAITSEGMWSEKELNQEIKDTGKN